MGNLMGKAMVVLPRLVFHHTCQKTPCSLRVTQLVLLKLKTSPNTTKAQAE